MKQQFKGDTYYSIDIETSDDGFLTTGPSCSFSSPPCIESAIRVATKESLYFKIVCGRKNVRYSVVETCGKCQGRGIVPAARKGKTKACPDCRGQGSETVLKQVKCEIGGLAIETLRNGTADILKPAK